MLQTLENNLRIRRNPLSELLNYIVLLILRLWKVIIIYTRKRRAYRLTVLAWLFLFQNNSLQVASLLHDGL